MRSLANMPPSSRLFCTGEEDAVAEFAAKHIEIEGAVFARCLHTLEQTCGRESEVTDVMILGS